MSDSTRRYYELDALRGLAALMVVFFHFTLKRPEAQYGFKYGVTGVDLFFIISGFVIFMTIQNASSWKDFVVSRFARLYPTYWAALALTTTLILLFATSSFSVVQVLINLTMLQHFVFVPDLDDPYWTLAVEMLFYGAVFFLLIYHKTDHAETIGVVALILLFLFHFTGPLVLTRVYNGIKFMFPILNHAPLFLAGIVFFKMIKDKPTVRRHFIVLSCFLMACYLHDRGGFSMYHLTGYEHYAMLLLYFATFYLFVFNKLGWIVNKYTVLLGNISYSLYLTHQYLSLKVIMPILMHKLEFGLFAASVVALIASLLVAYLLTFLIEKPANELIRRKYKEYKLRKMGQKAISV